MADSTEPRRRRVSATGAIVLTAVLAALVTLGVVALLVNIFERKQEARNPFYRVVELTDDTEDPAIWRKNFPQQYDAYLRTVDQVRTRYGDSEAVPRTPTFARSIESSVFQVVAFCRGSGESPNDSREHEAARWDRLRSPTSSGWRRRMRERSCHYCSTTCIAMSGANRLCSQRSPHER